MTKHEAIAAMIDQYAYDYDPYAYNDAHDSRSEGLGRLLCLMADKPQTVADDLRAMAEEAAGEAEAAQGRELLAMLQAIL